MRALYEYTAQRFIADIAKVRESTFRAYIFA